MAVMLRSGINQLDALTSLQRNASPWLKERLSAIHYGVSAGKNFGTALKLAGHQIPRPHGDAFSGSARHPQRLR